MTEFSKLVNKGGKVVRTADVVKPETQAEPETALIDDVPF